MREQSQSFSSGGRGAMAASSIVSGEVRRMERSLEELLWENRRNRELGARDAIEYSAAQVQDQLDRFLREQISDDFSVAGLTRMPGGGANESYRFQLTQGGETNTLVLRVKARGGCCDTHVPREFQVMRAIEGVLPIAKPYWVSPDPSFFGAPAFICGLVPGIQMPESEAGRASGMGAVYGEELRKKLGPQFVEYEAKLHAFDWSECDLSHFDIPRVGTTDAIDWRLNFYNTVWDVDKLEEHPTMVLTREWLWENRPVVDHVSILHGDFRNGNFLYDKDTAKITGILDWELCSLGDRHCDLGYTMLTAWGHIGENGKFLNSGLLDTEEFIERYEAVSGLSVDKSRLHYYLVFNIYWSAVALLATAINNAECRLTQLDVLYNLIAGKGAFDLGELNRLVVGK